MSTAKNRSKEEPEKGMSTRRSAKSTERESTTLLTPNSDKKSLPLLYLCSKCNAILSNSDCIFRTIELDVPAFLFPVQTETFMVNTDQVMLSSETEYDQFCAFYLVLCANAKCNSPLGKFYLSTTEKLSEAKSALVIPEHNLLTYDIKTSKVTTPAAKKIKQADITTAKKKVMSSTGRGEEREKEKEKEKENREPRSSHKEVSFAQQDRGYKFRSPMDTRIEEERKYDERSPNPLLESEEKDINQIKQVDNSFSEMKSILTNFAQLLEQFDIRLSSSEKTILLINSTLNEIYKQLNVQEVIDLSE